MYSAATSRANRRAESRARRVRQRRASARRGQRGQTMVIFALSVTVLLGLASLAIDAMRAYDLYAREVRAAEAGALAGVIYMPCTYDTSGPNSQSSPPVPCSSTTSPDGLTARQRALQQVQQNGFGTSLTVAGMPDGCLGAYTAAEVAVCGVSGRVNALQVTISEPITTFFLFTSIGGNGEQSFMVTATSGADYLASYVLGDSTSSANSNGWGDAGSNNPKYWMPSINGPAEFKETGDPFVYCEEGPSHGPLPSSFPTSNFGADENLWQGGTQTFLTNPSPLYDLGNTNHPVLAGSGLGGPGVMADSGVLTNHPQWGGAGTPVGDPTGPACGVPGSAQAINGGNPDQQPSGFAGPATTGTDHPGAYNYVINVPAGSPGVDVWIYNAPFDPTTPQSSCNGASRQDRFPLDTGCNVYYTNYGITQTTSSSCFVAPCPMITLNSTTPGNGNVGSAYAYLDDPRLYFTTTYALYAMSSNGNPGTSYATGTVPQIYNPLDTTGNDLARHGCTSFANGGAYTLADNSYYNNPNTVTLGTGCVVNPPGVYSWVPINVNQQYSQNPAAPTTPLGPGRYRLTVEASPFAPAGNPNPACSNAGGQCGWGHHTYGILVCQNGGSIPTGDTCPTGSGGGRIAAWNNMDIYMNFPSSTSPWQDSVPLADITSDFAGHTIEIGLFDPGDAHSNGGSNWFILVPPDCSINPSGTALPYGTGTGTGTSQAPWARTAPYPIAVANAPKCKQDTTSMFTASQNGGSLPSDSIYNGLWIWTRITLPDNYSGGEWYIDETSKYGKDFDQFAVAFRLDDPSPVHIIF